MNESRIASIIGQIDPPLSETRVTAHYGGPAVLLCWLGFHDKHQVEAMDAGRACVTYTCIRCGRTLAEVESAWEDDSDEV